MKSKQIKIIIFKTAIRCADTWLAAFVKGSTQMSSPAETMDRTVLGYIAYAQNNGHAK